MKKNFIKKLSVALVVALLLVNLFAFGAAADDGEYVKWWLSDDQTQIVNKTENITYNYAFYGVNLRPVPKAIYVYDQDLVIDVLFSYSYVHINLEYPEVIWVDNDYGQTEIFVTDRGAADLKSFVDGNIGSLRLEDPDGRVADISEDLVAEWDAALRSDRDTEVFDVIDIKPNGKKVEVYEIAAVDVTKTLAYSYGAVYSLSGEYWYLNYADLANNYFDANGNFSYRSGSVKMTRLSDTSELEDVISSTEYRFSEYTYEWDELDYDYEENSDGWIIVFWIFYAIFIVIPPIPVIILGIILPFIKKLGKPKYWFSLSAFALLWLIFAIALAILLIVILLI